MPHDRKRLTEPDSSFAVKGVLAPRVVDFYTRRVIAQIPRATFPTAGCNLATPTWEELVPTLKEISEGGSGVVGRLVMHIVTRASQNDEDLRAVLTGTMSVAAYVEHRRGDPYAS